MATGRPSGELLEQCWCPCDQRSCVLGKMFSSFIYLFISLFIHKLKINAKSYTELKTFYLFAFFLALLCLFVFWLIG